MKKKLIILFFGLSVSLLLISRGMPETGARFVSKDETEIDTTIGNLKLTVKDQGTIDSLISEESKNRKVSVYNDGEVNQFVRVLAHVVRVSDQDMHQPLAIEDIAEDLNTVDWKKGEDGYYYYLDKLTVKNPETKPLFTKVKLADGTALGKLTISIKSEGTVANQPSYTKAWWQGVKPDVSRPNLLSINTSLESKAD